jgi:hypothetical protein
MANTLTGLIPILYEGLDIVSREMVGLVRAVSLDSSAASAGVGQVVRSHVTQPAVTEDIQPGQLPPDTGDQEIDGVDIVITKSKAAPLRWTGEEQISVGGQINKIMVDQFAQGIRALVNEIEIDLALTGAAGASRAYGTAGTPPFGTAGDFMDFAGVNEILDANGAPQVDRQLALGSKAIMNLRGKQSILFQANTAGTDDLLRRGIIGDVEGLAIHNSAGIRPVTAGTAAGWTMGATASEGDTSFPIQNGTGAFGPGDVVTIAGDDNQYVVTQQVGNTLDIGKPGLLQDAPVDAALTIVPDASRNLGFSRNALHLATRAPAMPKDQSGKNVDMAIDVMDITDPVSGLVFQVAVYAQYRRVRYEVAMAWGQSAIKPEHLMILLG